MRIQKKVLWALGLLLVAGGIYLFVSRDLPWITTHWMLFVQVYVVLKLVTVAQGIYYLNKLGRLAQLSFVGIFSVTFLLFLFGGITFVSLFTLAMLASLFASKEFQDRMFVKLDQKLQLVLEKAV